jgi:hypothetical protein
MDAVRIHAAEVRCDQGFRDHGSVFGKGARGDQNSLGPGSEMGRGDYRHFNMKMWGSQSWLQPDFYPACR